VILVQVSVVLTLSSGSSDHIGGVIAAIADLLRIAVPPSYEISRSPSPDALRGMMGMMYPAGVKRTYICFMNVDSVLKAGACCTGVWGVFHEENLGKNLS